MGSNRLRQRRYKFGHCLGLHVAVLELPFVVGLEKHGADQADNGALVREDADDVGPALDRLVEPLKRVRRMYFGPVLDWEIHMRQHVGLALVDEVAELRPLRPKLVGDMSQRLAGVRAIGLDERLAQGS